MEGERGKRIKVLGFVVYLWVSIFDDDGHYHRRQQNKLNNRKNHSIDNIEHQQIFKRKISDFG